MEDNKAIASGCSNCQQAEQEPRRGGKFASVMSILASVLAVLPSFTCPACLAAYAGVLSAAGLGFLLYEPLLRPLIAVFLFVNIGALAWTARSHRSLGPLAIGMLGTAVVAVRRLVFDLPWVLYVGVGVLAAAALWNLWLKRPQIAQYLAAERA